MKEQDQARLLRQTELKNEVRKGVAQLDAGQYQTFASPEAIIAQVKAEGRKRLAQQKKDKAMSQDRLTEEADPNRSEIWLHLSQDNRTAAESLTDWRADLEALAEGTEHLAATPSTYARADLYFDHD